MKSLISRRALGLLAAALFLSTSFVQSQVRAADEPKAPVDTGKCMMWKVSSDTATVYLVGSIHLGTDKMYPLPKEMEDAYAKSDVLTVEINANKIDFKTMFETIQTKGMYDGDDTLTKHLSKESAKALADLCAKNEMPAAALEKFKPWLAEMTIAVFAMKKSGFDESKGIDKHFLDQAEKAKKQIDELESQEFQLKLLSDVDPDLQLKSLEITLKELDAHKDDILKIADAWIAGDVAAMAELMVKGDKEHPELAGIQKKLVEDRNGPMADKVEKYLKGNKTVFVIAGCAHMVGDKGIVKILEDRHYKVEQSPATREKPKGKPQ